MINFLSCQYPISYQCICISINYMYYIIAIYLINKSQNPKNQKCKTKNVYKVTLKKKKVILIKLSLYA